MNNKSKNTGNKTYSYKTRTDKIQLRIIDGIDDAKTPENSKNMLCGMESICRSKGKDAVKKAAYYDSYNFKATDPEGSYTGIPTSQFGDVPVQDVDDL